MADKEYTKERLEVFYENGHIQISNIGYGENVYCKMDKKDIDELIIKLTEIRNLI